MKKNFLYVAILTILYFSLLSAEKSEKSLNPKGSRVTESDIIGGYRVLTGKEIEEKTFLALKKESDKNKWKVSQLAEKIGTLKQTYQHLKVSLFQKKFRNEIIPTKKSSSSKYSKKKLNPTGKKLNDTDITGGFRVMTGKNIMPSDFEHLKEHSKIHNWTLTELAYHILDLDESQQHLKIAPINRVNNYEIKLKNMTLYGFESDLFIAYSIAKNKIWKDEIKKIIEKIVKKDDHVIDVGANIGYFTGILANKVGSNGRVIAIEGSQPIFELLEKAHKKNTWDHVEIIEGLLDKSNSKKWFLSKSINPGASSIIPDSEAKDKKKLKNRTIFQLKTKKLDDLLSDKCIKRLDFIKIDACGAEDLVFFGGEKMIKEFHPIIIMQFSPNRLRSRKTDPKNFLKRIEKLKYKFAFVNDVYTKKDPAKETLTKSKSAQDIIKHIDKYACGQMDILCVPSKKQN